MHPHARRPNCISYLIPKGIHSINILRKHRSIIVQHHLATIKQLQNCIANVVILRLTAFHILSILLQVQIEHFIYSKSTFGILFENTFLNEISAGLSSNGDCDLMAIIHMKIPAWIVELLPVGVCSHPYSWSDQFSNNHHVLTGLMRHNQYQ